MGHIERANVKLLRDSQTRCDYCFQALCGESFHATTGYTVPAYNFCSPAHRTYFLHERLTGTNRNWNTEWSSGGDG